MKPFQVFIAILLILMTISGALAFSTLSLSKVDFNSNDPQLRSPAWLLTVVENGNEQYATGTFTPDDITRPDGARTTQNIKIEIQDTKNQCQYTFQNQYTSIYQYEMRDFNIFTGGSDCQAAGGSFWYKEPAVFSTYCFIKTKSGQVTPLSTPSTIIESTIKASVGTETVSGTVNSATQRSVNLGSRAFASWEGNLVSGQQCPAPLDSGVMGAQANGQFFITNKAAYDKYDPLARDLQSCLGNIGSALYASKADYEACKTSYNARASAVMQKTSITPFSAATIGNGQAVITLQNLLQYPVITMRVRADWIGITIPVGKPEIVSVTSTPFTEGNKGFLRVIVKNVGDGKGSFGLSAICKDPAAQVGVSQVISLAPGASGYKDIEVSGAATGKQVDTTCTVTAQDLNQPSNTDKETVDVTIKPLAICNAQDKRCIENKIQTCNNAGSQWVDQEVCPNGCTIANGIPVCQNSVSCTTDEQCNDNDPTTTDTCVGIIDKQCKIVPIAPGSATDWEKYGKVGLFTLLALVFGIGATILGKKQSPWWYTLHLGTVIFLAGAIIGFFALFSKLAAFLIVFGIIFVLIGIAIAQLATALAPYAIVSAILGVILTMIGLLITFVQLPAWLSWL